MKCVVGIDYSMTCPALSIRYANGHADFWCSVHRKTPYVGLPSNLVVDYHTSTETIPRAHEIATLLFEYLQTRSDLDVMSYGIEGYAFAAKGKVFHIGEHAGILKYGFFFQKLTLETIAPTQVKKVATGKGNADKQMMTDCFLAAYPAAVGWPSLFFDVSTKKSIYDSPLTDLADAYWVAETLWLRHNTAV